MKETKMAKELKTTNKPDSAIKDDGRESMFRGAYKDDVYKDDPKKQEEVGTVEATQQESEGFMDANNASAVPNSEEIATEKREHDYKKRYDDLKKYYDQQLNEWKQEKETLAAQANVAEKVQKEQAYAPPKTKEELDQFREKYPDVYQVVETISHDCNAFHVFDICLFYPSLFWIWLL